MSFFLPSRDMRKTSFLNICTQLYFKSLIYFVDAFKYYVFCVFPHNSVINSLYKQQQSNQIEWNLSYIFITHIEFMSDSCADSLIKPSWQASVLSHQAYGLLTEGVKLCKEGQVAQTVRLQGCQGEVQPRWTRLAGGPIRLQKTLQC